MKITKQDVEWLQQILAGLISEAIPDFDRSRLVVMELIEERPNGLTITKRGQEALAQHFGLQRP